MTTFSLAMHALASLLILIAAILAWASSGARLSFRLQVGGMIALTVSLIARWIVSGHPPIFGTFENAAAATWFILAFVIADQGGPFAGSLPGRTRPALLLWAPVLLAFGVFFESAPHPLTISERSLLVDTHVLLAWAAHTVLLAVGTAAILQLVDTYSVSAPGRGLSPSQLTGGEVDARGTSSDVYHDFLFRGSGVGLVMFTLMIAVGSFYNYALFAQWFTWEIVEVLAIAAWLAYSSAIHSIMFFEWKGQRLAWVMVASTLLMLATFWVWSFYAGTYHHFEIPTLRAR